MGLYPDRQHKGRKLVLADRTEALVYILGAHEARHMWQQHGTMKNSSFPVGRVKNAHGIYYGRTVLNRVLNSTRAAVLNNLPQLRAALPRV